MADPTLTSGQYSIGTEGSSAAFVYGGRAGTFANSIQIANTTIAPGSLATQDQVIVGHDGMLFGIDTMPGMVVTQTGQARGTSPAATMDAYDALAGAWNDPTVRLANNSVICLRAFYPGSSVIRRCYGRGRQIAPAMGQAWTNLLPFTAQFQASDGIWYSDTQSQLTLPAAPPFPLGGIAPPLTPPFQLSTPAALQNSLLNTGPQPTWPIITFNGPVSYPGFSFVNTPVTIKYNGILAKGDKLVVDTRPWTRYVLLNGFATVPGTGGQSVAGLLLGSPLIAFQAPPGSTICKYTGTDWTGTSYCTVTWRNAHLSIGGSS